MKQKDVKINGVYSTTCSGERVQVKVLHTVPSTSGRAKYRVKNLTTGREIIRSAAALH